MKDLKISNKLLSLVFGCECEFEFVGAYSKLNDIEIDSIYFKMFMKSLNKPRLMFKKINLHTFIHLAKIKAFECGYDVVEYSNSVKILDKKKFYPKVNYNRFTVELIIEALEWVAEKVGGDSEHNRD